MQQFGTVSGTLRSWRFGCDGQAKSFTSHLGAYELIWRVVTYSKYFFQEYKKSIQRNKVREDTVELGFSREGKEIPKLSQWFWFWENFIFTQGRNWRREFYLLVGGWNSVWSVKLDSWFQDGNIESTLFFCEEVKKNSGYICQSKYLLSNFEVFFVWEPQKFV